MIELYGETIRLKTSIILRAPFVSSAALWIYFLVWEKAMRDLKRLDDDTKYVPANVLAKQGVAAVAGIAGGTALLVMGALPSIAGVIVGGVVTVVGIGSLLSKDPDDKKPGAVLTAAGFLAVASKVGISMIKPLAGTFLGLGAIGMFAMGVWNGIKFIKGLKKRSS
jgi:hypothetical protein